MCLISLRWAPDHAIPLIIAANRDEYYQRSSLPAQCWKENPDIFAGKDLVKGGTWLGINTVQGKLAILTNFREKSERIYNSSRGNIVSHYLQSSSSAIQWLKNFEESAESYAGFNLLVGDPDGFYYYSNREPDIKTLQPGLYGFSNGLWHAKWPKVLTLKQKMTNISHKFQSSFQWSSNNQSLTHCVLSALHNQQTYDDDLLPETGCGIDIERNLSPCFIKGHTYGTRTSTAIQINNQGMMHWGEQHYLQKGNKGDLFLHKLMVSIPGSRIKGVSH